MGIEFLGKDHLGRDRFKVRYRVRGKERTRTFYSIREAKRFDKQIMARRSLVQLVDPGAGRRRFGDGAAEFERGRHLKLGQAGRLRDTSLFQNHILPYFDDRPLASIHRTEVQHWVNFLREQRQLAPATVRRIYEIFVRIMEGAVDSHFIGKSPCRNITLPPERRRRPRALTLDEVWRLADAIEPRYRAYPPLGAMAGLRPGELAGLRARDIDFLRGTLSIVQGVTEHEGHIAFTDLKNENAARTITLPPSLVELLSVHVRDFVKDRPPIPGHPTAHVEGLLFFMGTWKNPLVLRPNNFRRRKWARAVKKAGLDPCPPKILRASHGTLMAELEIHPAAIQGRLGHGDPQIAQEFYIAYNPAMDAQVAAELERAMRNSLQRRGPGAARTNLQA